MIAKGRGFPPSSPDRACAIVAMSTTPTNDRDDEAPLRGRLGTHGWVRRSRVSPRIVPDAMLDTANKIAQSLDDTSRREVRDCGAFVVQPTGATGLQSSSLKDSELAFAVGIAIADNIGCVTRSGEEFSNQVSFLRMPPRMFPSITMAYARGGRECGFLMTVALKHRMGVLVYSGSHLRDFRESDDSTSSAEVYHSPPEPERVQLEKGDILIQDRRLVFARCGTISMDDHGMCNALLLDAGPVATGDTIEVVLPARRYPAHEVLIHRELQY